MLWLECDAKLPPRFFTTVFNDSPSASHGCHSLLGKIIDFEDWIVNSISLLLDGGPSVRSVWSDSKAFVRKYSQNHLSDPQINPDDVDHFITVIAGFVSLYEFMLFMIRSRMAWTVSIKDSLFEVGAACPSHFESGSHGKTWINFGAW